MCISASYLEVCILHLNLSVCEWTQSTQADFVTKNLTSVMKGAKTDEDFKDFFFFV